MADTETYTDADYERMAAALAERNARLEAERQVKRAAYAVPVKELINSDDFKATLKGLNDIKAQGIDDDRLSFHVNALIDIANRLQSDAALVM